MEQRESPIQQFQAVNGWRVVIVEWRTEEGRAEIVEMPMVGWAVRGEAEYVAPVYLWDSTRVGFYDLVVASDDEDSTEIVDILPPEKLFSEKAYQEVIQEVTRRNQERGG
ncbi:MAG: hypothetical protein KC587_12060 [Nitrospira sp.]|nr:hypothetical protein [Nitrospira sp.]